jgi:hypothetical protein
MSTTVTERADRIATFRFVEVRLMEVAAAWTPTTPEMEVKVLFGRHIWDFARHADALGKRTFELRRPEQHSLRPVEPYARLLDDVGALTGTAERLSALYDVLLPGLEQRYRRYLEETDPILDGPSVVVLDTILLDLARQRADAGRLRQTLGLIAPADESLRGRERAIERLTVE